MYSKNLEDISPRGRSFIGFSSEWIQRADLKLQFGWRRCSDEAAFQIKLRNIVIYLGLGKEWKTSHAFAVQGRMKTNQYNLFGRQS